MLVLRESVVKPMKIPMKEVQDLFIWVLFQPSILAMEQKSVQDVFNEEENLNTDEDEAVLQPNVLSKEWDPGVYVERPKDEGNIPWTF